MNPIGLPHSILQKLPRNRDKLIGAVILHIRFPARFTRQSVWIAAQQTDLVDMELHSINVTRDGRLLGLPQFVLAEALSMSEFGHGDPGRICRLAVLNLNSQLLGIARKETATHNT